MYIKYVVNENKAKEIFKIVHHCSSVEHKKQKVLYKEKSFEFEMYFLKIQFKNFISSEMSVYTLR